VIAGGFILRKQKGGAPEDSKHWTNVPENTVTTENFLGSACRFYISSFDAWVEQQLS